MPERFLSMIVTLLPALREIEQRLDREAGRRFNMFNNLVPADEPATSRFIPQWQQSFDFPRAQRRNTRELIDVVISDGLHWLGVENKIERAVPASPKQNDNGANLGFEAQILLGRMNADVSTEKSRPSGK